MIGTRSSPTNDRPQRNQCVQQAFGSGTGSEVQHCSKTPFWKPFTMLMESLTSCQCKVQSRHENDVAQQSYRKARHLIRIINC
jgi:hypothetical protein